MPISDEWPHQSNGVKRESPNGPFGDIERAPLESFSTAGTDSQALFRRLHSVDDLSG